MVDVGRLPLAERIMLARLAGVAARHAGGRGDGDPVAALHAISRDPRLLGITAGQYAACEGDPQAPAAADLLAAAGADPAVTAAQAVYVRQHAIGLGHSI